MTTHLTRRRFLAISAAAMASPVRAEPVTWQGFALGAEVSLSIHAPAEFAEKAIAQTRVSLREIEKLFSLYDPASLLSELNRRGVLANPPASFRELTRICAQVHMATGGVFDPTIQPLWQAVARGDRVSLEKMNIGWHHVRIGHSIRLGAGQSVTLNGIAQGYATDLIRTRLAKLGLTRALINIGEFSALGGPFRLGLADPVQGMFATRTLTNRAIATSSPGAMRLGDRSHILHPSLARNPLWSTVSVEADSAAIADAASTAFVLMTRREIRHSLGRLPGRVKVTLLAEDGDVQMQG